MASLLSRLLERVGLGEKQRLTAKRNNPYLPKPSKRAARHRRRSANANREQHPYRSVSINSRSRTCAAASRIQGRRFLSAHAPQLPLGGCEQAQQCQCRYQHHVDRRQGARRDSDHGLPANAYIGENRRHRKDRRRLVPRHSLAS